MENEFNKNEVTLAFEALAARLEALDGYFNWDKEIEMIREALTRAGYN